MATYLVSADEHGGIIIYSFVTTAGETINIHGEDVKRFLGNIKVENLRFEGNNLVAVGGLESYIGARLTVMAKTKEKCKMYTRAEGFVRVDIEEAIEYGITHGFTNARIQVKNGEALIKLLKKTDTGFVENYRDGDTLIGRCMSCGSFLSSNRGIMNRSVLDYNNTDSCVNCGRVGKIVKY